MPSKGKVYDKFLCTYNNPTEDTEVLLKNIYAAAPLKYVGGQLEKGENGTPHIQFCLYFEARAKRTPLNCKLWLTKMNQDYERIHIVPVTKDNGIDMYCCKEETRLEGPFQHGEMPKKV